MIPQKLKNSGGKIVGHSDLRGRQPLWSHHGKLHNNHSTVGVMPFFNICVLHTTSSISTTSSIFRKPLFFSLLKCRFQNSLKHLNSQVMNYTIDSGYMAVYVCMCVCIFSKVLRQILWSGGSLKRHSVAATWLQELHGTINPRTGRLTDLNNRSTPRGISHSRNIYPTEVYFWR